MRAIVLALSLLALGACGDNSPSSPYIKGSPPHYVNSYYGLDVAIPRGAEICVDEGGPTSSHGFLVILEPGVDCKAFSLHHRHMNVYVGFEVVYDFPTVAELAAAQCGRALLPPGALQGIVIPGHAVSVCRDIDFNRDEKGKVVSSSDRTETKAMALFNGVELIVSLVTTDAHTAEDMDSFRRLLSGVKLEKKPAQQ